MDREVNGPWTGVGAFLEIAEQNHESSMLISIFQTLHHLLFSLLYSRFLVSSRNAPPHKGLWRGALRDDSKNGCVADYLLLCRQKYGR